VCVVTRVGSLSCVIGAIPATQQAREVLNWISRLSAQAFKRRRSRWHAQRREPTRLRRFAYLILEWRLFTAVSSVLF
jgi:hypothetical protein